MIGRIMQRHKCCWQAEVKRRMKSMFSYRADTNGYKSAVGNIMYTYIVRVLCMTPGNISKKDLQRW